MDRSNFIFPNTESSEGDAVIYNSRTGSLALLEHDKRLSLEEFSENLTPIDDEEFMEQLRHCGFLIDDDYDEIKQIKLDSLTSKFSGSILNLTIAPTMDCNFRCIYCFEEGQRTNQIMSSQTIEKLAEFIRGKAAHLERLNVLWYGGEPLLAMQQIESISRRVIEICKEHKVAYGSSMITNGYLLTAETAEILKDCGVGQLQITIDGNKEAHNRCRPLVGGGGTFDKILHNLTLTKGIIPVSLRINVDKQNQDQAADIVHMLKELNLLRYVQPYLGRLFSYTDGYDAGNCLSCDSYSVLNLRFMRENNLPLMNMYPTPKGNCCSADHSSSFVIDSQGHFYKCYNEIGIESRRISSLYSDVGINSSLLHSYMLFSPTDGPGCNDCKYLPICMGGCPYNRLMNWNSCTQHKYVLKEYLEEYTKSLMEESFVPIA